MTTIRNERSTDIAARERLLDAAFGPARFAKPSERLREDRFAAEGLSFVAVENGRLVGTARLWNVSAGLGRPALLLGPLAVAADARNRGIGAALVQRALREARRLGHRAVLLVGDAAYYGRFGFSAANTGSLRLPGPFEPERLLGIELKAGALDGARGLIRATGDRLPKGLPDFLTGANRAPVALAA
ncbi:MAG TPA: N-acetyltransferase [Xanthobacteraceae bacterium]|nr:N-acetyltransferase [Xanthobacteraceae bacterium]